MNLIIKDWINIFKGIWNFVKFQSYLGITYPSRIVDTTYEVPNIRETGKKIIEDNKETFYKLRISELEDRNKELERQKKVSSSWYVPKDDFEAMSESLAEAKEVMSMLEADVETWKQLYLKARASGYQEGLEQASEDAKRSEK